jgi:S1-C subfamily serine protease
MDSRLFMREAPKMYAMVRSIFEFIADHGLLSDWYAAYVANFDEDDTGRKAFEEVFRLPIDDVERKWRQWIIARPDVATSVRPGSASLGIEYQPHAVSDGVLVMRVFPGSAAGEAGLRERDVIVAVDDEPTRSGQELTIRIAARAVGDFVMLRVRRDGRYLDIGATLHAFGRRGR